MNKKMDAIENFICKAEKLNIGHEETQKILKEITEIAIVTPYSTDNLLSSVEFYVSHGMTLQAAVKHMKNKFGL